MLAQVGAEPEHDAEVVRGELDGGLADLVRRRGQGPPLALDHGHAGLGHLAAELAREREAGEAPAADDDVKSLLVAHEWARA